MDPRRALSRLSSEDFTMLKRRLQCKPNIGFNENGFFRARSFRRLREPPGNEDPNFLRMKSTVMILLNHVQTNSWAPLRRIWYKIDKVWKFLRVYNGEDAYSAIDRARGFINASFDEIKLVPQLRASVRGQMTVYFKNEDDLFEENYTSAKTSSFPTGSVLRVSIPDSRNVVLMVWEKPSFLNKPFCETLERFANEKRKSILHIILSGQPSTCDKDFIAKVSKVGHVKKVLVICDADASGFAIYSAVKYGTPDSVLLKEETKCLKAELLFLDPGKSNLPRSPSQFEEAQIRNRLARRYFHTVEEERHLQILLSHHAQLDVFGENVILRALRRHFE